MKNTGNKPQGMTDGDFAKAVNHGQQSKMVIVSVAIYEHPKDYPNKCVARVHFVGKGKTWPSQDLFIVRDTVDECRAALPPGMKQIPPSPQDVTSLVETWI